MACSTHKCCPPDLASSFSPRRLSRRVHGVAIPVRRHLTKVGQRRDPLRGVQLLIIIIKDLGHLTRMATLQPTSYRDLRSHFRWSTRPARMRTEVEQSFPGYRLVHAFLPEHGAEFSASGTDITFYDTTTIIIIISVTQSEVFLYLLIVLPQPVPHIPDVFFLLSPTSSPRG